MDTSYDTDTDTRGEKPWSVLQPRRRRNFNAVQFRANEREPLDDGAGEESLINMSHYTGLRGYYNVTF